MVKQRDMCEKYKWTSKDELATDLQSFVGAGR